MADTSKKEPAAKPVDAKRESGQPGGGQGRKDETTKKGVWPMSGPLPEGDAETVAPASFGQGKRGAAGYEDSGGSDLESDGEGGVLGGTTAGPDGKPTIDTHGETP